MTITARDTDQATATQAVSVTVPQLTGRRNGWGRFPRKRWSKASAQM